MQKTTQCDAIQMSDQMCCAKCGLAWDVNDLYPPECGKRTGVFRTAPCAVARSAIDPSPGFLPYGYSSFVIYKEYAEVILGWANSPEQMVAMTLSALGFDMGKQPPAGLEVVVYREESLDRAAYVSRQRVSFIQMECDLLRDLLINSDNPTAVWEDVRPLSALIARKKLEESL